MKQGNFGRILLKNILLALGIVLVLVFVVLKCLDFYTRHGKEVTVPDVKGLSTVEAQSFLTNQGLQGVVVDSTFVKNKPSGTILETIPPVGNRVKAGRTIYLTINSHAARLLTVPEVTDISQRQALAMLKSSGFERVVVKSVSGAYENLVVGLEDGRGKKVEEGARIAGDTPLYLLVSNGIGELSEDPENDGEFGESEL
ncbi:MAG: PASTA domain-containing protein [Candidatus Symbiothrix sp.]|jgi:beta-lactam-binding protein with PASTA domain|nr:PASTA domain-containing protein [Candidatus Symbiothrix sp.]